jgi:diaminohydroxyphosphoribosylaminopyrimidine deaminase/5-amino-6-(5-phosphoribosylamino)uracil reductase
VGSVIVRNDIIIGEGYHEIYGGPHAEVNAINSVKDKNELKDATIYVSLEPCSHFGKTPPCADLIIANKIPRVVIAAIDSNTLVCGNGIAKLKNAGIEVITGIMDTESHNMNKRFNTFHEKKRPFVTLKWAQTNDGFIDKTRSNSNISPLKISNGSASIWVHKLRSETDAILVGKKTAELDNPSLTTRRWDGKNPVRVVIDHELKLKTNLKLFNQEVKTLVFNSIKSNQNGEIEYIKIANTDLFLNQLLTELWKRNIQSILIEGGAITLQQFIDQNIWDEAFVIQSEDKIQQGVTAPILDRSPIKTYPLINNQIFHYE